jgi:hypothetical protein
MIYPHHYRKRITMKYLIYIALIALATNSYAEEWGEIGESYDGTKHYYDIDSLKKLNGYKFEFWQKTVDKQQTTLQRSQVDCVSETYTFKEAYIYKKSNVEPVPDQNLVITPPPGTAAYLTLERVCNYGVALEFSKLNMPKREDYQDDVQFEMQKIIAFGFGDYEIDDEFINDYLAMWASVENEKIIYRKFVKILTKIDELKLKYIHLKLNEKKSSY